ncbi:palmitoyltransferase ZDHHC4-like [Tubulanus polymorphus]|uniref:palmitoyltransferase ZDHHC4-like n=1 Tax=Tubulanus polymorphus TaxID=672921 RepID=UPI003DA5EFE7
MDFIPLFIGYVIASICFAIIYALADQPFMKTGLIGRLRFYTVKTIQFVFPRWFRDFVDGMIVRIFYKRNPIFQCMYLMICFSGYFVLIVDVIPFLYAFHPNENHVALPAILFIVCKSLYAVCCISDPGVITADSVKLYEQAYPYDETFYKSGVKCATCKIPKPARSKHCSRCDRCIYKFDHHCIWTNSCIGGKNCGLFFVFLISLCTMNINGIVMPTRVLNEIVDRKRLWSARYVDDDGVTRPVTFWILIQHLFMHYPRMVFMVVALTAVTSLIVGFTVYHVLLTFVNQTTNERYRIARLTTDDSTFQNPYNKGIVINLGEAFRPQTVLDRASRRLIREIPPKRNRLLEKEEKPNKLRNVSQQKTKSKRH